MSNAEMNYGGISRTLTVRVSIDDLPIEEQLALLTDVGNKVALWDRMSPAALAEVTAHFNTIRAALDASRRAKAQPLSELIPSFVDDREARLRQHRLQEGVAP